MPAHVSAGEPRVLFVPVSGVFGMGEYARSLAIAQAVRKRWPAGQVRFVLSAQAPYIDEVPFEVTRLPASATFHTAEVLQTLREFRPDAVIFDNAGRSAQLRAAKFQGAQVIFISARRRQRRRAFRLRWMRLLAEHWIAYPEFVAGGLSLIERCKLKVLKSPTVRYLDVIQSAAAPQPLPATLASRIDGKPYVLLVPGGGTGHPGVEDAGQCFLEAAERIAASGRLAIVVGAQGVDSSGVLGLPRLAQSTLLELMSKSQLVVANGGATLLQAIARRVPCVGVPIAKDQPRRIASCVAAGVAREARLDAADMAAVAGELLSDDAARQALMSQAAKLCLADGAEVAVAALENLLKLRDAHA